MNQGVDAGSIQDFRSNPFDAGIQFERNEEENT